MEISLSFAPQTLGESLGLSLLGMGVVMLALAALIVAIKCQSVIVGSLTKKAAAAAPAAPAPAAAAPAPVAAPAAPALDLVNVDDRTAAFIMAIVAEETQIPLNELQFKSIKRV